MASKLRLMGPNGNELCISSGSANTNKLLESTDFKYIRETVSQLSTIPQPQDGEVALVKGYHDNTDNAGGTFIYRASMPKSSHNGGTIIDPSKTFPSFWNDSTQQADWFTADSTGNGCWERLFDDAVNVKWFGAKGDGVTDDTTAIQQAINNYDCYGTGEYLINRTLKISITNRRIKDLNIISNFIAQNDSSANSNNQGQCIEILADGVKLDNVLINGGSAFNSAGVFAYNVSGIEIIKCNFNNSNGQLILFDTVKNSKIKSNILQKGFHGVQLWKCDNIVGKHNEVTQVTGGMWTGISNNIVFHTNNVSHCLDVGVDFEGGYNCVAYNNNVSHCNNGELTIFPTGSGLVSSLGHGNIKFYDNICERYNWAYDKNGNKVETGLTDAGSLMIYDIDDTTTGDFIYDNNKVYVIDSTGNSLKAITNRVTNLTFENTVIIKHNEVVSNSSDVCRIQELNNLIFSKNYLITNNPNGFDKIEIKDINGVIDDNTFIEPDTASSNTGFIVSLYTDVDMNGALKFTNNNIISKRTTPTLLVDQYVSNRQVFVANNNLPICYDDSPITVNNGYVIPQNQDIVVHLSNDFSFDVSTYNLFMSCNGAGVFTTQMGGQSRAQYTVYTRRNIAVTTPQSQGDKDTGLFPDDTTWANISGTTIQPQDNDSNYNNSGILKLTLNRY